MAQFNQRYLADAYEAANQLYPAQDLSTRDKWSKGLWAFSAGMGQGRNFEERVRSGLSSASQWMLENSDVDKNAEARRRAFLQMAPWFRPQPDEISDWVVTEPFGRFSEPGRYQFGEREALGWSQEHGGKFHPWTKPTSSGGSQTEWQENNDRFNYLTEKLVTQGLDRGEQLEHQGLGDWFAENQIKIMDDPNNAGYSALFRKATNDVWGNVRRSYPDYPWKEYLHQGVQSTPTGEVASSSPAPEGELTPDFYSNYGPPSVSSFGVPEGTAEQEPEIQPLQNLETILPRRRPNPVEVVPESGMPNVGLIGDVEVGVTPPQPDSDIGVHPQETVKVYGQPEKLPDLPRAGSFQFGGPGQFFWGPEREETPYVGETLLPRHRPLPEDVAMGRWEQLRRYGLADAEEPSVPRLDDVQRNPYDTGRGEIVEPGLGRNAYDTQYGRPSIIPQEIEYDPKGWLGGLKSFEDMFARARGLEPNVPAPSNEYPLLDTPSLPQLPAVEEEVVEEPVRESDPAGTKYFLHPEEEGGGWTATYPDGSQERFDSQGNPINEEMERRLNRRRRDEGLVDEITDPLYKPDGLLGDPGLTPEQEEMLLNQEPVQEQHGSVFDGWFISNANAHEPVDPIKIMETPVMERPRSLPIYPGDMGDFQTAVPAKIQEEVADFLDKAGVNIPIGIDTSMDDELHIIGRRKDEDSAETAIRQAQAREAIRNTLMGLLMLTEHGVETPVLRSFFSTFGRAGYTREAMNSLNLGMLNGLRADTGAAVTDTEFERYDQLYLPQMMTRMPFVVNRAQTLVNKMTDMLNTTSQATNIQTINVPAFLDEYAPRGAQGRAQNDEERAVRPPPGQARPFMDIFK